MNAKQWALTLVAIPIGIGLGCFGAWVMDQNLTFPINDWNVKADKSAVVCAICAIIGLAMMVRMLVILQALRNDRHGDN